MNNYDYDYIIIGAGLSGSTLAYLLKRQKYNVLLIEKQDISKKEKLCGGILTPKAYNLLTSLFEKDTIDSFIQASHTKCVITSNISIILDNCDFKIIDRKALDSYILNLYLEEGGDILQQTTIDVLNIDNDSIFCNGTYYKYKKLIAADGTLSQIRKFVTGKIQDKNFALEAFTSDPSYQAQDLEIDFKDNFKGYTWIVPSKKHTLIGIGDVSGNTEIKERFNSMLDEFDIPDEDVKGAFLPNGSDILLRSSNVYFIGDAAGLISPITGEGIYFALHSANTMFNCIKYSTSYESKMKKSVNKIRFENLLSKLIYNTSIRNYVFNIMAKESKLSDIIKNKMIDIICN